MWWAPRNLLATLFFTSSHSFELFVLMKAFMCIVQVARAILENPQDHTQVSLIYANVTHEDILLKVHILWHHTRVLNISGLCLFPERQMTRNRKPCKMFIICRNHFSAGTSWTTVLTWSVIKCLSYNVKHLIPQDDLDRMAKDHPDQFKVYYVLNQVCVAKRSTSLLLSSACTYEHAKSTCCFVSMLSGLFTVFSYAFCAASNGVERRCRVCDERYDWETLSPPSCRCSGMHPRARTNLLRKCWIEE